MVVMEHSRCWGELRGTLCHICRLRPLWTLDNFEFNRVPFVQGFVSLAYDCRVMDKYIGSTLASDEAVAFRVIEPLDRAFHLLWSRRDANSEISVWQSIIHQTPCKLK